MKFNLDDIKKELERPQESQKVTQEAIDKQSLVTLKGLQSEGILPRHKRIYDSMAKYLTETKLDCRKKGLLLFGNPGTGKSFAVKVIAAFRKIHLYTCDELEEKHAESKEAFWQIIKEPKDIIIDDLGTESEVNDFGNKFELFEKAINERHRLFERYGTRTLITANMSGEAIKERYSERIYSRLHEMCECVNATGEDLRRKG